MTGGDTHHYTTEDFRICRDTLGSIILETFAIRVHIAKMALRRSSQAILASIVRGGLHRSSLRAFQTTVTRLFDVQSEDDFEKRVLEAKTPVIVDFHAG